MTDLPFESAAHVYSVMFLFTPEAVEVWKALHQVGASRLYFKLKVQL